MSRNEDRLVTTDTRVLGTILRGEAPELVAGHLRVARRDGASWHVSGVGFKPATVEAVAGEHPLGVIVTGHPLTPRLVTVSESIVRLRAPGEATVFTEGSGAALARALHPRLPLLAVQREEDYIEVLDVTTGDRLQELRAE